MPYNRVEMILFKLYRKRLQTLHFYFQNILSLVKENRRLRTKCDGLNGPCVVDIVGCTNFSVANCAHKSLKRDDAQG